MTMSEQNMMTAPAQAKKQDLAAILQGDTMKQQWAVVLPKCLTADRLARVALTQLRKTPKLGQCNQGSFLSALMTCAELGIEPNGRHAHLIPYGQDCTLIIDYKGLVELAMRSGKISRIHADVVCENDTISIKNGIITHEINPLKERGTMVGAYAMCAFIDGTEKHEYMSKKEVDSIRDRSRAGKSGPWVSDYNEMAKKTVFRRMSKWLPLSPEIMDSIEKDADRIETVHGTASAPVYMEAPHFEEPEMKQAEPVVDDSNTDLNGDSRPNREPPAVGNMSKIELLQELKEHEGTPAHAKAMEMLPEGCQAQKAPTDFLRDMVELVRNGGEK
jgi:recombination protein RecT